MNENTETVPKSALVKSYRSFRNNISPTQMPADSIDKNDMLVDVHLANTPHNVY